MAIRNALFWFILGFFSPPYSLSLYFHLSSFGVELHNIVNLSEWRELCYLEILLAGPIYSELLPFTAERKTPLISPSAVFVIDLFIRSFFQSYLCMRLVH